MKKTILNGIITIAVALLSSQFVQAQGTMTYLSNVDQASAGSLAVGSDSWVAGNDSFNTYFRFKPDGDSDNIYVTLGLANWDWYGNVDYTGGLPYDPWTLSNWTISGAGVDGPTFNRVNNFPVWPAVYNNWP